MKDDIPDYRSRGLTRKVLIAMHNAPRGCFVLVAAVVGVLLMPLTSWLLDVVIGWLR